MGIVNVNSDSFVAASRSSTVSEALKLAGKHRDDGAFFLDLGATSTRPGAKISDPNEEWDALFPVLKAVRSEFPEVIVSVDTYHASVMSNAVSEGADLINDISGGRFDPQVFETVIRLSVPYVLSHIQGKPGTMQVAPHYTDVVAEVLFELAAATRELRHAGLSNLVVDPGFGFGKTVDHNYKLLNHLSEFKQLNAPVLVGLSRKSMVTNVLNVSAKDALNGTTALHVLAIQNGANILRVHDVKEADEAIRLISYASGFRS